MRQHSFVIHIVIFWYAELIYRVTSIISMIKTYDGCNVDHCTNHVYSPPFNYASTCMLIFYAHALSHNP